ncbi:MAG: LysR substrate-binding domain-containing protein [Pseudomonadota bacterium]
MNGLTLKHLRYFNALAKNLHFGRASAECAISQPALSIQIKELEAMVGAPLVERTSRQVRLTTLGEDFVGRARNILAAVDELDDLVRSSTEALTGRLRLGVIPTIAPYLLPGIAQTLAASHPEVDLQPREAVTQALVEDLLDHSLDAALVALPVSEPRLIETPLFEEEFVLVRHESDASDPIPSPDRLLKMRLLLLEEGHCFRDQALAFCAVDGTPVRDVMEGSSLSTLVQMVGAGIGLTLIPEIAVPFEARASGVHIARFKRDVPRRTIGLVMRRTSPMAEQLDAVNAIVRDLGTARVAQVAQDFP